MIKKKRKIARKQVSSSRHCDRRARFKQYCRVRVCDTCGFFSTTYGREWQDESEKARNFTFIIISCVIATFFWMKRERILRFGNKTGITLEGTTQLGLSKPTLLRPELLEIWPYPWVKLTWKVHVQGNTIFFVETIKKTLFYRPRGSKTCKIFNSRNF